MFVATPTGHSEREENLLKSPGMIVGCLGGFVVFVLQTELPFDAGRVDTADTRLLNGIENKCIMVCLLLSVGVRGQCLLLLSSWEEFEMPFWFWDEPEPRPYSRPQYLASSMLSSKNNCRVRNTSPFSTLNHTHLGSTGQQVLEYLHSCVAEDFKHTGSSSHTAVWSGNTFRTQTLWLIIYIP